MSVREWENDVAHRGPLVTAIAVLLGLMGLMAVNSAGGLVVAGAAAPAPSTTAAAVSPTAVLPSAEPSPPELSTAAPSSPPAPSTVVPSPPPPAFPAEVAYAGRADGGVLAIAVAIRGDRAAAYLCDGRRIEAWFSGTAAQGRVELATRDGSGRLSAALVGDRLRGETIASGQRFTFAIGVAAPPTGVYRGTDGSTTIGWIVLPDGSQVGIATSGGSTAPAPRLDPQRGSVTLNGRQLEADPLAGDTFPW